jgi:hypothetical protein
MEDDAERGTDGELDSTLPGSQMHNPGESQGSTWVGILILLTLVVVLVPTWLGVLLLLSLAAIVPLFAIFACGSFGSRD